MVKRSPKKLPLIIIGVATLGFIIVGAIYFAQSRFNIFPQLVASHIDATNHVDFPSIDPTSLTPEQQHVITILEEEYALQPDGTKYSEGISEAWCADFVSWVFNEAEVPLSNPNSGSWRIPGTYTLREYYESIGKFKPASSGYSPKVGDIMLYDNPSPFGQHTNIIIANDNGIITTIGGNEPGGIRIVTHDKPDSVGFIGFGVL